MNGDARPIGICLIDPCSPTAALLLRAQSLIRYQQALQEWAQSVPPKDSVPGTDLHVVNYRDGTLVIHADNAAALIALRFRVNGLLRDLQIRFGHECSRIDAKVRPTTSRI